MIYFTGDAACWTDDGEIVLAFFKRVPELWARFALHMPGKNYIMEKWTKKSE